MEKDSTLKQVSGWIRVNGVLTFGRCSIARESGEPSKTEKLETAQAGAFVNFVHPWHTFSWRAAREHVRGLQMRIAKAVKENNWGKVQTLQRLLTNSFYAKLLAVKRVTSNKGKNTLALMAFCGKTLKPSGRRLLACADVVISHSH